MVHSSKTRNFRGIVAAVSAVAAGLILIAVPQAANAAENPNTTENPNAATATPQASQQTMRAGTCIVNSDFTIVRAGPGDNYEFRKFVDHGQGFNVTWDTPGNNPSDGYTWAQGNLWGGESGVWIRADHLDGPFPCRSG